MQAEFDIDEFRRDGVAPVRGAFSADAAADMRDAIWRHIEGRTSTRRDDPSSWKGVTLPSFKSIKQRPVFRPFLQSPPLRAALDDVFGVAGWAASGSGVQVLFTFPDADTWVLPDHLWHMDAGFGRSHPASMVKVFACVDHVRARGGGTLALAGSSRLVDRDSAALPVDQRAGNSTSWRRFLDRHAWTSELIRPGVEPARTERLMGSSGDADGIALSVLEMTGDPGDAYVTDIHTFHCIAPNAQDRPRMMLGWLIQRARPT